MRGWLFLETLAVLALANAVGWLVVAMEWQIPEYRRWYERLGEKV